MRFSSPLLSPPLLSSPLLSFPRPSPPPPPPSPPPSPLLFILLRRPLSPLPATPPLLFLSLPFAGWARRRRRDKRRGGATCCPLARALRGAMAGAQLSDEESRRYILSLERSSRHSPLWNSHFVHKRPAERMAILLDGWPPVAALNLGAVCLQRWARGHRARVLIVMSTLQTGLRAGYGGRVPDASRRVAAAAARASEAARARRASRTERQARVLSGEVLSNTETSLISRFLEAKLRLATFGIQDIDFPTWALMRLQAWFRMVSWRRYFLLVRSPLLLLAAASIQYEWRSREYERRRRSRRRRQQSPDLKAALLVQHRWRCYTNRMIFRYFRDLINFREQGDPAQLLRSINPKEAALMDIAISAHVRFRLGGSTFPPTIYYKVFTHGAVTDVCAFAPRDYTAHKKATPVVLHNKDKPAQMENKDDRKGWYRRIENNGWRPVRPTARDAIDHPHPNTPPRV